MIARKPKPGSSDGGRGRAISELAVLVQFGELVVAIQAQRVVRIVLAHEAEPLVQRSIPHVRIGADVLPSWDLGLLLGFREEAAAWIVMTADDAPDAPVFAIGTGPCIAVTTHAALSVLPPGIVTAPPSAVLGVFPTDAALRERGLGHLGVRIDPVRLIGTSALATARRGAL